MVEHFNALGDEARELLEGDAARIDALLAERDALLAQLTTALSDATGSAAAHAVVALEGANRSTASLIRDVAERTDRLRAALRTASRGARAGEAYRTAGALPGPRSVSR